MYNDWGDLFNYLALNTKKGKWIILLDEISWMGSKDTQFLQKLKNTWDLYFKKNPNLILILCGSISSWIEDNILSSTGFLGRLSLRLNVEELPASNCLEFWNKSKKISIYDKMKVLSVTGGVPRYLEEVITNKSAEENIKNLCFNKNGILFYEFDNIFSDLFNKRNVIYKRIVTSLSNGAKSMLNIIDNLKIEKGGVLSTYLEDLRLAGFITRDFAWNLKTSKESKISKFRLKDNYLRFYLKYIEPNKNSIQNGFYTHKPLSALPEYNIMMGFQFENLVLNNRKYIWEQCRISPSEIVKDGPLFQTATKQRKGCQIDYCIQTKYGSIYLCEIKFHRKNIGNSVINEVKRKMTNIKIPKYCSILPVLIHLNGVTESLKYSDFFSKIVDFSEIES